MERRDLLPSAVRQAEQFDGRVGAYTYVAGLAGSSQIIATLADLLDG